MKSEEKVKDTLKENKALQKRCLSLVEREADLKNKEVEAAKSQFSLSSVLGLTSSNASTGSSTTTTTSTTPVKKAMSASSLDLDGGVFGVTVVCSK